MLNICLGTREPDLKCGNVTMGQAKWDVLLLSQICKVFHWILATLDALEINLLVDGTRCGGCGGCGHPQMSTRSAETERTLVLFLRPTESDKEPVALFSRTESFEWLWTSQPLRTDRNIKSGTRSIPAIV